MTRFARKKRVADLFDELAKARLVGPDHRQPSYVGSGSEHSGDGDGDGNSPSLSELVHDFLENNNGDENDSGGNELDSERVDSVAEYIESVEEVLRSSALNNVDPYRNMLKEHVSEALEKFAFLRSENVSLLQRNVMVFLRERGHNAAICKTWWDSAGGIKAGNHEFIDVVQSSSSTWQNRYFVDVDFAGQFAIARPTSRYSEILSSLPGVFVGTAEVLKRTVQAVCGVVKRCFRSRGFSVPPWRKSQYMQNKWFAPYRRTANPFHGKPVPAVVTGVAGATCRLVEFENAGSEARHGGVFVHTR